MSGTWTRRQAGGAVLGALLLPTLPAAAQSSRGKLWRVDPDASRIAFLYTADGVAEEGRFERFRASGFFTPQRIDKTELTLSIETASIDLSDSLRTGLATSETWFDVERFPKAEFRLTELRRINGARHKAEGLLTIKGIERQIAIEMDLTFSNDEAHASGEVEFNRMDFNVGDNSASFFVDIADPVSVRFELVAHPAA